MLLGAARPGAVPPAAGGEHAGTMKSSVAPTTARRLIIAPPHATPNARRDHARRIFARCCGERALTPASRRTLRRLQRVGRSRVDRETSAQLARRSRSAFMATSSGSARTCAARPPEVMGQLSNHQPTGNHLQPEFPRFRRRIERRRPRARPNHGRHVHGSVQRVQRDRTRRPRVLPPRRQQARDSNTLTSPSRTEHTERLDTGCSSSPRTRTTRSPSTVTTMPHAAAHMRQ